MKPSIVITMAPPIIVALIMSACGGGQDQPTGIQPVTSPQAQVSPQQESTPPYGPGPTATPPAPPQGAQGETRSMGQHDMAAMCPLSVEGTSVRAEATPDGVALVFTTTGDVDELRRKVEHMAEMHNQHHSASPQHSTHGQHTPGQTPGPEVEQQPGGAAGQDVLPYMAEARVEHTESGARILFTPTVATHLDPLREDIQHHATEMMLTGMCPAHGFMSVQQPTEGQQPEGQQLPGQYGGQQYGGQ